MALYFLHPIYRPSWRTKSEYARLAFENLTAMCREVPALCDGPVLSPMDEGRKRVLAIVAGILVARHLKTTDDGAAAPARRLESLVAAAVQWAERDHAED